MQLKKVVEPFGEVNLHPGPGGTLRVVATILMEPCKEGAQTGIALDGSGSMRKVYGIDTGGGVVSSLFAKPKLANNVSPVAQQICAYLARTIDADGGTTAIYWAVGPDGGQIEPIGDLRADDAERFDFKGPRDFGTGTQLLPAVRYFVDRFPQAPWGFYTFITDGELFDLEAVKQYSTRLAQDIAAHRRNPVKFVLIGLGPEVNEKQMEELDDLDTGTDLDLWDHKLAAEMRQLQEIFAEVVDKNARVADNGKILDPQGRVVKNYSDTGLPAFLAFEMPAGSSHFTLEVNGQRIQQSLSDQAAAAPIPASLPPVPAPPRQSPPPLTPANIQGAAPMPIPAPPPVTPLAESKPAPKKDEDEVHDLDLGDLSKSIDLEFSDTSAGEADLELEKHEDDNK